MSIALYNIAAIRSWSQNEIEFRDLCIKHLSQTVIRILTGINKAWSFERCETPALVPLDTISAAYDGDDLWLLQAPLGKSTPAVMRPETTDGSYRYARHLLQRETKVPLCVWQAGQSHRRETNDGASAEKLRFNQFWQLEFQCIYSKTTIVNYILPMTFALKEEVQWLMRQQARIVSSDRLPGYSAKTDDIEVFWRQNWKEVASISKRMDFSESHHVLEIAFGLDRLVEIATHKEKLQVLKCSEELK